MKTLTVIVSTLVIVLILPAHAETLGPISAERNQLLTRIQCVRESNTPAGGGLGSLWGCYNGDETVKLWINGVAGDPSAIRNIKLAVVQYHRSKRMGITGRIWAKIIAEEYGGSEAESIVSKFEQCPIEQTMEINGLRLIIKCSKGPKADEHLLIVYPN